MSNVCNDHLIHAELRRRIVGRPPPSSLGFSARTRPRRRAQRSATSSRRTLPFLRRPLLTIRPSTSALRCTPPRGALRSPPTSPPTLTPATPPPAPPTPPPPVPPPPMALLSCPSSRRRHASTTSSPSRSRHPRASPLPPPPSRRLRPLHSVAPPSIDRQSRPRSKAVSLPDWRRRSGAVVRRCRQPLTGRRRPPLTGRPLA